MKVSARGKQGAPPGTRIQNPLIKSFPRMLLTTSSRVLGPLVAVPEFVHTLARAGRVPARPDRFRRAHPKSQRAPEGCAVVLARQRLAVPGERHDGSKREGKGPRANGSLGCCAPLTRWFRLANPNAPARSATIAQTST